MKSQSSSGISDKLYKRKLTIYNELHDDIEGEMEFADDIEKSLFGSVFWNLPTLHIFLLDQHNKADTEVFGYFKEKSNTFLKSVFSTLRPEEISDEMLEKEVLSLSRFVLFK